MPDDTVYLRPGPKGLIASLGSGQVLTEEELINLKVEYFSKRLAEANPPRWKATSTKTAWKDVFVTEESDALAYPVIGGPLDGQHMAARLSANFGRGKSKIVATIFLNDLPTFRVTQDGNHTYYAFDKETETWTVVESSGL